jgi:hypothetical protein
MILHCILRQLTCTREASGQSVQTPDLVGTVSYLKLQLHGQCHAAAALPFTYRSESEQEDSMNLISAWTILGFEPEEDAPRANARSFGPWQADGEGPWQADCRIDQRCGGCRRGWAEWGARRGAVRQRCGEAAAKAQGRRPCQVRLP